jgi:hypothetical protein
MDNTNFKEFDYTKLTAALEENRMDEAKTIIDDFFNTELTPEDRGAILVNLALIQARIQKQLNDEYLPLLQATISGLKEIDSIEKENEKEIDIDAIRKQIREM